MRHPKLSFWFSGLLLVGMAVWADPLPTAPTPGLPVVNPTSGFKLPEKPPAPKGKDLLFQIMMAVVTVGGCALGGTALVVLDAKYARSQESADADRLKTIRSIEYGFLGVIVVVGALLLVYAGVQLLKSAGIL